MALSTINEYRAIKDDGTEQIICAASITAAATALETGSVVLEQVARLRRNVSVEIPDTNVRFNVSVFPTAAGTAGCVAMPETFVVAEGDKVVLQAVTAGGYNFLGWYRGVTVLSTDAIASIAIVAPASGAVADEIVAKFELA